MLVEVALEGEGLPAAPAHVRLGAGVRLYVRPQVGLVSEGLAADGAREGLLPRVRPYVALQQPGPAEALAAIGAPASLSVRPHVHAVGRHRDVHLVAVGAAPRLLVGGAAVRLPVARQVAGGAVALAALAARVHVRRRRRGGGGRGLLLLLLLHQLSDDRRQGGAVARSEEDVATLRGRGWKVDLGRERRREIST